MKAISFPSGDHEGRNLGAEHRPCGQTKREPDVNRDCPLPSALMPDASGRAKRPPALPPRTPAWPEGTGVWWARLWRSPMAPCYLEADLGALHRLARLVDDGAAGRLPPSTHAMITALEDRFGLSPQARARLMWQMIDRSCCVRGSGRDRRRCVGHVGWIRRTIRSPRLTRSQRSAKRARAAAHSRSGALIGLVGARCSRRIDLRLPACVTGRFDVA